MSTLIVGYLKTRRGLVVVSTTDHPPQSNLPEIVLRFEAFFCNVPLHGGQEWQTLAVGKIVQVFREAAGAIRTEYLSRHNHMVRLHSKRWWTTRRLMELSGWKPPYVPSEAEILRDMADRCSSLSEWAQRAAQRPFYTESDMSVYIEKPMAVAALLMREV